MSHTCRIIWILALPIGAAAPGRAQSPPGVPVQVAVAARQDVPVTLRNIGTVQATNTVVIRTRVDGTIDQLFFTEGQEVTAGQKLAQIDPRPYAAAYAQARARRAADEAAMANAQRDLTRTTSLARNDFASRQQLDTQTSNVAQAQAALQGDEALMATAKLNLDYATITAPIDGRVGLRMVDVGNLVHAADGAGIVTLTQIHPISILFTLPQDTLPLVQDAMAAGALAASAFAPDERVKLGEGVLLTIDNQIDPGTGTIRLKASFPNRDNRLWPGQFVNVRLRVATLKGALTVPSAAVQHGPSGLFAFVVKPDATVGMQPVTLRQDQGGLAVIEAGLDEGASVVIAGQSRLQNGTRVAVTIAPANG